MTQGVTIRHEGTRSSELLFGEALSGRRWAACLEMAKFLNSS